MKILVLNCGSSSIKYALYNMDDNSVMTSGGAERVGLDGAFVKVKLANGEKKQIMHDIPEHTEGVKFIFSLLTDPEIGVIKSLDEIDAVGHRMVHGGEKFAESVIEAFEAVSDLAPLHNPANMKGVNAVSELMPGLPQVGVFDTAFHQTMPAKAYMYAVPWELYEKYGVRRYGFHGTSHRYVSKRACDFLGIPQEGCKMVTAHIGNGGSLAAVVDGKCVDTTMGLTPLEGVMMGTRSGDIDGGAVTFIQKKLGLDADGISNLLNKKSGVQGLCGFSDMRDVESAAKSGDQKALVAQESYFYRIKKYIGAYAAAMGGIDVLVFTAGVGENQSIMREMSCEGLEFMGIKIDKDVNNQIHGKEAIISTPDSKVKVVVIPTDEELMIATDTMSLVKK